MRDSPPGVLELCDEIAAMTPLRLLQESGGLALHPWRAELEAPERLAAAWGSIADLRQAHGARTTPLQIRTLEQAWARLGGDREMLFHVRPWPHGRPDLRLASARSMAPRHAIDPNPGVPRAPCLEHPISLAEVARFATLLPLLRVCTSLGEAAMRALDAIGQPTTALSYRARMRREPPRRRAVWRRPNPARDERPGFRMVTLTAAMVLVDIDDTTAMMRHPSTYRRLEAVVRGALAWRVACANDVRVGQGRPIGWHTVNLGIGVGGRRYRELEDPFAPLLAIFRLGCCMVAGSPETMSFELRG